MMLQAVELRGEIRVQPESDQYLLDGSWAFTGTNGQGGGTFQWLSTQGTDCQDESGTELPSQLNCTGCFWVCKTKIQEQHIALSIESVPISARTTTFRDNAPQVVRPVRKNRKRLRLNLGHGYVETASCDTENLPQGSRKWNVRGMGRNGIGGFTVDGTIVYDSSKPGVWAFRAIKRYSNAGSLVEQEFNLPSAMSLNDPLTGDFAPEQLVDSSIIPSYPDFSSQSDLLSLVMEDTPLWSLPNSGFVTDESEVSTVQSPTHGSRKRARLRAQEWRQRQLRNDLQATCQVQNGNCCRCRVPYYSPSWDSSLSVKVTNVSCTQTGPNGTSLDITCTLDAPVIVSEVAMAHNVPLSACRPHLKVCFQRKCGLDDSPKQQYYSLEQVFCMRPVWNKDTVVRQIPINLGTDVTQVCHTIKRLSPGEYHVVVGIMILVPTTHSVVAAANGMELNCSHVVHSLERYPVHQPNTKRILAADGAQQTIVVTEQLLFPSHVMALLYGKGCNDATETCERRDDITDYTKQNNEATDHAKQCDDNASSSCDESAEICTSNLETSQSQLEAGFNDVKPDRVAESSCSTSSRIHQTTRSAVVSWQHIRHGPQLTSNPHSLTSVANQIRFDVLCQVFQDSVWTTIPEASITGHAPHRNSPEHYRVMVNSVPCHKQIRFQVVARLPNLITKDAASTTIDATDDAWVTQPDCTICGEFITTFKPGDPRSKCSVASNRKNFAHIVDGCGALDSFGSDVDRHPVGNYSRYRKLSRNLEESMDAAGPVSCSHVYHSHCLVKWARIGKKTCPLCNERFSKLVTHTFDKTSGTICNTLCKIPTRRGLRRCNAQISLLNLNHANGRGASTVARQPDAFPVNNTSFNLDAELLEFLSFLLVETAMEESR